MAYRGPITGLATVRKDRLERALKARNMSGTELARLMGTSQQRVNGLRFGRTSRMRADDATRIEAILGVERGHIFTYGVKASVGTVQMSA